jgi:hypothetical protein
MTESILESAQASTQSRRITVDNCFMKPADRHCREQLRIKVLEKDRKFKAGYDIAEILEPLSQWCSIEAAGNERKLLVHADNTRAYTAKLSIFQRESNEIGAACSMLP